MTGTDVERRALALYERLVERPHDQRFRDRLLRRQGETVMARVEALERSGRIAALSMPTEFGGGGSEQGLAPERIGPFRLEALIGRGGMGEVWKGVRDDGLYEQTVAIKLLHSHLARLAGGRFAEERRILARLEHPNIARLIDGGVTDAGVPYLIMEHVEGAPIDEAAAGRPLAERVELFRKAADAVAFAHSRLVVHADLKPSNILVPGPGWVKLLDFGIARLLDRDDEPDSLQHPMTRAYASPARLRGASPVIADDVYSLGLILHNLVDTSGDRDLLAIVAKATAGDEIDRYGSVVALSGDLDRWRERLPVTAQASTLRYRAARFIARHRAGVAATIAALLLLSSTSVAATWSYLESERARSEASARFDDVRGTARYLLFDLYDRLERLPGSLTLRTEVARVSQSYLDRLSSGENAPLEVRQEAAEGLIRLAERQGGPGRPNLGQGEAARASLNRAIAALAPDRSAPAALLRARALIARSRLELMTFSNPEVASDALRNAAPIVRASGDTELRAEFLIQLARIEMNQGRYLDAIRHPRAVLALPAAPDDYGLSTARALATDLLGDATYYADPANGPTNSLPIYRSLIEQWEAIGERWRGDPLAARKLPQARYSLGTTLLSHAAPGHREEAEQQLALGSREIEQVSAANPDDFETARLAFNLRGGHAQALAALGRTDQAVATMENLIELARRRWREAPSEMLRLRTYAIAIAVLADIEADAGRVASACPRYGEVARLFGLAKRIDRHLKLDEDSAMQLNRQRRARHCASAK